MKFLNVQAVIGFLDHGIISGGTYFIVNLQLCLCKIYEIRRKVVFDLMQTKTLRNGMSCKMNNKIPRAMKLFYRYPKNTGSVTTDL